jgi:hypothetical protein
VRDLGQLAAERRGGLEQDDVELNVAALEARADSGHAPADDHDIVVRFRHGRS